VSKKDANVVSKSQLTDTSRASNNATERSNEEVTQEPEQEPEQDVKQEVEQVHKQEVDNDTSTASKLTGPAKVTKQKNKGRVEAGKRLALLNKIRREATVKNKDANAMSKTSNIDFNPYVIGGAGIMIAICLIYYNKNRSVVIEDATERSKGVSKSEEKIKRSSLPVSKDDF